MDGERECIGTVCDTCCIPEKVTTYIKGVVPDRTHDQLFEDIAEKLRIYQGHRIRVAIQRHRIDFILENLVGHQAYMTPDFKMKFEAMYHREKTVEFYEKKGLSWHVVMVYVRYTDAERAAYAADSNEVLASHHITYIDQIPSGDSK